MYIKMLFQNNNNFTNLQKPNKIKILRFGKKNHSHVGLTFIIIITLRGKKKEVKVETSESSIIQFVYSRNTIKMPHNQTSFIKFKNEK